MATRILIKNISQDPLTLPLPLKGVLVAGGDVVTSLPKATLLELFNVNPYGAEFVELVDLPLSTPVTPGLEGAVDMGGATFTNVGAPLNDTDVATKAYVDTSGGGGGGGITQLTADVEAGPAAGSTTARVVAIQNNAVSATAPTINQVLTWDGSQWIGATPTTPVTDVTATAPLSSTGGTTPDISISLVTTSADGAMSSADKSKLDGIAAGANIAGTIATNQIAFGTSPDAIGGSAYFTADSTAKTVTLTGDANPVLILQDELSASPFVTATPVTREIAVLSDPLSSTDSTTINPTDVAVGNGLQSGNMSAGRVGVADTGTGNSLSIKLPGAVATIESVDGSNNPFPLNLVIEELQINANPGNAGEVLTSNGPNFAPTWTTPAAGTVTSVGATAPITSTGGTTPTIGIAAATTLAAGSMSASDKLKLDGITAGAAVASVGTTSPLTNTGTATAPVVALTSGGSAGNVLTWDGSAWTGAAPAAAGITALTGDVTASGSGSVPATVAKIQGYDVATTAPTSNQILQWISGTSKWTPTANGVGLGSKVLLVVEGGAYATIQAAIDAAADWDVILVGPKASGASWGPAVFSPGKRLVVSAIGSKWSTQVKVDSISFNANSGANILLNTVFVRGLFISSSFTALAPGVNFYGSAPARLRLQECFVFNNNAAGGTGVVSNNSGSGSSLYVDNCVVQSTAFTGVGLDHQQGYTIVRGDCEISRYQYPLQCAAGTVEVLNTLLDGTGIANEVVRITGGTVTCGYSTIKNTTTNASGVNLTAAGAVFGAGDATFSIATGTGYCVNGPASSTPTAVYLYGNVTYSNSAAGAFNVKVKNTISAIAVAQAFTSSP